MPQETGTEVLERIQGLEDPSKPPTTEDIQAAREYASEQLQCLADWNNVGFRGEASNFPLPEIHFICYDLPYSNALHPINPCPDFVKCILWYNCHKVGWHDLPCVTLGEKSKVEYIMLAGGGSTEDGLSSGQNVIDLNVLAAQVEYLKNFSREVMFDLRVNPSDINNYYPENGLSFLAEKYWEMVKNAQEKQESGEWTTQSLYYFQSIPLFLEYEWTKGSIDGSDAPITRGIDAAGGIYTPSAVGDLWLVRNGSGYEHYTYPRAFPDVVSGYSDVQSPFLITKFKEEMYYQRV